MELESKLVENLEWGLELARKKSAVEKEWESEEALEKGKAMEKESALEQQSNRQYMYHSK